MKKLGKTIGATLLAGTMVLNGTSDVGAKEKEKIIQEESPEKIISDCKKQLKKLGIRVDSTTSIGDLSAACGPIGAAKISEEIVNIISPEGEKMEITPVDSKDLGFDFEDIKSTPISNEQQEARLTQIKQKIEKDLNSLDSNIDKKTYNDYLKVLGGYDGGYEDYILKLVQNPEKVKKTRDFLKENYPEYGKNEFLTLVITVGAKERVGNGSKESGFYKNVKKFGNGKITQFTVKRIEKKANDFYEKMADIEVPGFGQLNKAVTVRKLETDYKTELKEFKDLILELEQAQKNGGKNKARIEQKIAIKEEAYNYFLERKNYKERRSNAQERIAKAQERIAKAQERISNAQEIRKNYKERISNAQERIAKGEEEIVKINEDIVNLKAHNELLSKLTKFMKKTENS